MIIGIEGIIFETGGYGSRFEGARRVRGSLSLTTVVRMLGVTAAEMVKERAVGGQDFSWLLCAAMLAGT